MPMFPSVMIFIILISAGVEDLLYSQGLIVKKKTAHIISVITVATSVLAKSSTFKRTNIGIAFCSFTPESLFTYPLKVCSNKDNNGPSGSLTGLSLKAALKA